MRQDEIMRDLSGLQEPETLAALVSYRIRLLQIASYKSFEQKVKGFGSAPRYCGMLMLVEANPGIPQTRLAEAIFLDRSSLVPILETLTREGWIERRSTPRDRRVRRVFLTEDGKLRLKALKREVKAHEDTVTAGFSDVEKAQLLSLLDRVDGNLRAAYSARG